MPRFFFHLIVGSVRVEDSLGMVLCDADAARLKRIDAERAPRRGEFAMEIERDRLVAIEVRDEHAEVNLLVPVRDAILPEGFEPPPKFRQP